MFFYQPKNKEIKTKQIKMRDEWGTLHHFEMVRGVPFLTDQELADQLQVSLITVTVETHRRD